MSVFFDILQDLDPPFRGGVLLRYLGERLNGIQEVSGSIPLISTKSTENTTFSVLFLFSELFGFSVMFRTGTVPE